MLEIQRHNSDIGQSRTKHQPVRASITGIERTHVRTDIIGVGDIWIDGNARNRNIWQISADIGPRIAAIDCLKDVPGGIGVKARKTAAGCVSRSRGRGVNLDIRNGSRGESQAEPARGRSGKGVVGERKHRVVRSGVDRIGIAGRYGDDGERASVGQVGRDCGPGGRPIGGLVQIISPHINIGRIGGI
jgi:hypothetical protein